VASLPRLPVAAEHRAVKFFCGLPPWLRRLLFGRQPDSTGRASLPTKPPRPEDGLGPDPELKPLGHSY